MPTKEASWAGVRDKLVNGELDMAHVLYGLLYGVHLGTAGPKKDMAVLMNLNNNGQAITLSKALADKGAVDGPGLAKLMAKEKREYTFAGTFPTGTHAPHMPSGRPSGFDRMVIFGAWPEASAPVACISSGVTRYTGAVDHSTQGSRVFQARGLLKPCGSACQRTFSVRNFAYQLTGRPALISSTGHPHV